MPGWLWEGLALKQGHGETRFPHTPARGRVWEGAALPGMISSVCGASRMEG